MKLVPRYDGTPIISIEGPPDGLLAPTVRQRRRLEAILASIDRAQWAEPSRCELWTISDVVAHLVSVNTFWTYSITMGLARKPTRFLQSFDPVVTPEELIADVRGTPPESLLERLITTNNDLIDLIGTLDESGWSMPAECPVGHLPVRLVVQHGLWDSWIHERDIALPLGLPATVEPDEVVPALVYASALGPALALNRGDSLNGEFALATSDPSSSWVLQVADVVAVRAGEGTSVIPLLEGDSVELTEAISRRIPIPAGIPDGWLPVFDSLTSVFDVDRDSGTSDQP